MQRPYKKEKELVHRFAVLPQFLTWETQVGVAACCFKFPSTSSVYCRASDLGLPYYQNIDLKTILAVTNVAAKPLLF